MNTKVPYYYKDFNCLASKCPDTCCAGWEIIIDPETYEHYKSVTGEFGERLKSKMTIYEDDEPGFILEGDDNCPFLNKNNLCDIYTELGEESLCVTCKTFPRIIEEYGSLREIAISLSCPEAARLILKDSKKVTFEVSEDDELVNCDSDISYDMYINILPARQIIFDILQNRNLLLKERLALILGFACDIQNEIDDFNFDNIKAIRNNYSNEEFQKEFLCELNEYKNRKQEKYDTIFKYINTYAELEHLDNNWPHILEDMKNEFYINNNIDFYFEAHEKFNEYYKDKTYEFEHLLVYFIFRYFMKSLFDDDVYSKVKLAVISYLMIKEADVIKYIQNDYNFNFETQVDVMHMYSKEVEHSENNILDFYYMFENDEIFDFDTFITLIMNE